MYKLFDKTSVRRKLDYLEALLIHLPAVQEERNENLTPIEKEQFNEKQNYDEYKPLSDFENIDKNGLIFE